MSDNYSTRLANAAADYTQQATTARLELAKKLGGAGLDAKRNTAWLAYGYPAQVTDQQLRLLFKRNGIARGVVELTVDGCWQTDPSLIQGDEFDNKEKETPEEKTLRLILQRVGFWRAFHLADTRREVSGCAGLLFDFGANSGELNKPVSGRRGLAGVQAIWKASITPAERDRMGVVQIWNVLMAAEPGAQPTSVPVHRERLLLLGDWDEGESLLEANYNDYVNLEKVTGGSGESYLKNASRTLHLDYQTGVGMPKLEDIAAAHNVKPDGLKAKLNKTARDVNDGLDALLVTQGATATPLVATVPDPQQHFDISISSIAARTGLPQRAIVGNQTGERASTEDNITLNRRAQGRRKRDLTPEIQTVTQHLMNLKAVPVWPEFSVIWDDLTTPTIEARLANAKVMAEINSSSLDGPIFQSKEIREEAGYDALAATPPLGEDLNDEVPDGTRATA